MTNLTNRPIYEKAARKPAKAPKVTQSERIKKSAKGQQCRADWCECGGSTDTTVFCHVRKFGIAGTGIKPPDFIGFYGCAKAHQMFDQSKDAQWSWEGVMRAVVLTQIHLNKKGLLYAA
jgi:hypothetical protein